MQGRMARMPVGNVPQRCCQTLESVLRDVKMPRKLRNCYGGDAA